MDFEEIDGVEENLPVLIPTDGQLQAKGFEAARFKIGDEVAVHVDGGFQTVGEWTLPFESRLGIIHKVLLDEETGAIAYVIDEVNKLTLKKTGSPLTFEGSICVLEGFVQFCLFLEVKLHNFQSFMASEMSRPGKRSIYGENVTMVEKDLIRMQMKFYEYGKKGIFPPEWDKDHRATSLFNGTF